MQVARLPCERLNVMNATQRWGGFALGAALALIGLLLGATTTWVGSPTALVIGGAVIAIVHAVLLAIAHRRK